MRRVVIVGLPLPSPPSSLFYNVREMQRDETLKGNNIEGLKEQSATAHVEFRR